MLVLFHVWVISLDRLGDFLGCFGVSIIIRIVSLLGNETIGFITGDGSKSFALV